MFFTFKFRNAESSLTKFEIIFIRVIRWQFHLNSHNLHHSSSSFQRVTVFQVHLINCLDFLLLRWDYPHCYLQITCVGFYELYLISQPADWYQPLFDVFPLFLPKLNQSYRHLEVREGKCNNVGAKAVSLSISLEIPSDIGPNKF